MNVKEAIMALKANAIIACERAGFSSATVRMVEDALDTIKDALKEQEAKPVIVTTNAYGTRFYHCPRCNRDLYAYPRQSYCSNCGQAVKWDEDQ